MWEGVPGDGSSRGDECSMGMSVLGDGCLGGWEFLIPVRITFHFICETMGL